MQLRYYQRECIDGIYDWYNQGNMENPLNVLATGTGKSVIIGQFIKEAIDSSPNVRIACAIDTKELVEQNYEKLLQLMPNAPAGIYSSGLKRREHNAQILFCGIQSVYKKAFQIGKIDVLLIDECHMVGTNEDTMWRQFINDLQSINPKMIIIGFTATPYRMDSGLLHTGDDAIFGGIAYEYSVKQGMADGYLSTIIPKSMVTKLSVDGVGKRGGEYIESQLQKAVDKDEVTIEAIDEIIKFGKDRQAWLVFGSGVKHCKSIKRIMQEKGIDCDIVLGDTPDDERDELIKKFKNGELKCLINNAVLTKGFDAPFIDLIAAMRPTASAVLWMQMVGRGFRIADGKENCLLLDFAQNVTRFGFIDEMVFKDKRARNDDEEGVPPMKECDKCGTYCYASVRFCPECGYEFPIDDSPKIDSSSHAGAVLSTQRIVEEWLIDSVTWDVHRKSGKTPSLKVTYYCGIQRVSEWVCLAHEGFARKKAVTWWNKNTDINKCKTVLEYNEFRDMGTPTDIEKAMKWMHTMKKPAALQVTKEGKYDRIVGRSYEELIEAVEDHPQQNQHVLDDFDDLPF